MAIPMVDINYVAVIAATVVGFIIGMIWYGPIFGKTWAKLSGVNTKQKKGMGGKMIAGLISTLIFNFVLAYMLGVSGVATMSEALMVAFLLWLGFNATVLLGTVLWEGKPGKLYVINTLHYLVTLGIGAAIIMSL